MTVAQLHLPSLQPNSTYQVCSPTPPATSVAQLQPQSTGERILGASLRKARRLGAASRRTGLRLPNYQIDREEVCTIKLDPIYLFHFKKGKMNSKNNKKSRKTKERTKYIYNK
jgi:hypothetical protein